MQIIRKKLLDSAIQPSQIMIPAEDVDLGKWCVIACDQYTSDPGYWEKVYDDVGRNPSTLHLILPEVYLNAPGKKMILRKITREMKRYMRFKILNTIDEGFIYVRRTTSYGHVRNGLMACIDLEKYSFTGEETLVRPTERTLLERIPPRLEIREKAILEIPHVMLLIDDPAKSIIEPFEMTRSNLKKIYDVRLMANGGQVEGYAIHSTESISRLAQLLANLANQKNFSFRYGTESKPLVFAVGDGNHSLACAKQHWENLKPRLSKEKALIHPARLALVEIVNIHDKGLVFHPIHRVIKNMTTTDILEELKTVLAVDVAEIPDGHLLEEVVSKTMKDKSVHSFGILSEGSSFLVKVRNPSHSICTGTVQAFLDDLTKRRNADVDYIHDISQLRSLSASKNTGFLLPPVDKSGFFKTIIEEGTFPVKTFSIGHADEKRFYLEARKISL